MTSTNKHSYLRLFNFAILGIVLLTIISCVEDSVNDFFQLADLEVYVSGTLSGNPRSGLKVAIYETEDDAMNEVNAITPPQFTNDDGIVYIENIEPDYKYWVRVDTTLIHNINQTEQLNEGFNEISMTIL